MTNLTPREIVSELDKFIIGQKEAKKAVAIALRNRWRRMQVNEEDRAEIYPKNILMIGPTGVGKTEIARRLATIAKAPFIKVEATKYTEVGYVGKEVGSIIKELAEVGRKIAYEKIFIEKKNLAIDAAEERVLDVLVPQPKDDDEVVKDNHARQVFRKKLREHELDDKEIEINVPVRKRSVNILLPSDTDGEGSPFQSIVDNINDQRTVKRTMKIKDAMKELIEDEAYKMTKEEDFNQEVVNLCENSGIVFIDEIDKICGNDDGGSRAQVSRQGVQRDLLPLIEGSQVRTKYGMIRTDHILFIASGAFQMSKPSDLIPELQGRLPIRVELQDLTTEDFERILKEPKTSLTKQYELLLATENVTIKFTDDAIKRLAQDAFQVNERTENIGARRLHTIMEKLLETLSFEAPDHAGSVIEIDEQYVQEHLADLVDDVDLSRYIL